MKLQKFKEENNRQKYIIIFTIACVLFITGVFLYKTFASFQVIENEDLINGNVSDPGDVYFAFYVDGVLSKEVPQKGSNYVFNSKESYCGKLGKKDDNIIPWYHREDGSITVEGILTSHTKCVLYFESGENFIDKIKEVPIKEEDSGESGLYKVSHEAAEITYTEEKEKQDLLKQEELRYAGSNPDNYVWFNHELWRIIGLVNTPEGQRIKLIRNDSIGMYAWDSSENTVNKGYGVNEWSTSDVNQVLNDYYSQNKINQTCYTKVIPQDDGTYVNQKDSCSFDGKNGNKIRGLKQVDELIDTVTWNTGALNMSDSKDYTAQIFYNDERSNRLSKTCNSGTSCNDNVPRTILWKGRIALPYMSDYIYSSLPRGCSVKISQSVNLMNEICYSNNWMSDITGYTLNSVSADTFSTHVIYFYKLNVQFLRAANNASLNPTLYLKTDVLVSKNTNGTIENPYII